MFRCFDEAVLRDYASPKKNGVSLNVGVDTSSEPAYGKPISDLMENVTLKNYTFFGKLKHVEQYTQFSNDPEEQEGNYLVVSVVPEEEAKTKFELLGGTAGEKTLDPDDHQIVCRIRNTSQKLKITSEKEGRKTTSIYSMSGLKLEPKKN